MIDPELKIQLDDIHKSIKKLDNWRWWKALLDGSLKGFGSVLGVVLAVAFIGWMLNIVGVIPAFKTEVEQWRKLLQETQRRTPINAIDQNQ